MNTGNIKEEKEFESKFMNPMTQSVLAAESKYREFFQTKDTWKAGVEKDIQDQSDGKIRAFHIFFNTPAECFLGTCKPQALTKQDMINMYPSLYEQVTKVKEGKFMYIFNCNNAVSKTEAIGCHMIV